MVHLQAERLAVRRLVAVILCRCHERRPLRRQRRRVPRAGAAQTRRRLLRWAQR